MLCLWLSEVFVVGRNYTYIYTQAPVVQNGELKHNQARLITGTLWSFVAGTTEQVDATAWTQPIKDNHVLMLSGKDKGSFFACWQMVASFHSI